MNCFNTVVALFCEVLFMTILMLCLENTRGVDVGFEMLFTSNNYTTRDKPIRFSQPLPFRLNGDYVKNGVGCFSFGKRSVVHVFDGFSKLYKISFNGRSTSAEFTTKFLQTEFYKDSVAQNDIARYTLFDGADPPFNYFQNIGALIRGVDNPNVNIMTIKNNKNGTLYLAISDYWKTYSFDLDSLDTLGSHKPSLPTVSPLYKFIPVSSAAHPVPEHGTTNYLSFFSILAIVPDAPGFINVIRTRALGEFDILARISREQVPYMHCLAATKHYTIIFAHPLFMNKDKLLKTGTPMKSLEWHSELKTDIYLVHTVTGDVLGYKAEPHFNMHVANSYESPDGKTVIVDMITYPDLEVLNYLELKNMLKKKELKNMAQLARYTIDLILGIVKLEPFQRPTSITALDLPVINERYRLEKYCFVYGMILKADFIHTSNITLGKMSVCDSSGESDRFWMRENHYPSEPWFLPKPGASREDDGLLISIVLDGTLKKSYLLVLDAARMKEISIAYLPTFVPFNLHGKMIEK